MPNKKSNKVFPRVLLYILAAVLIFIIAVNIFQRPVEGHVFFRHFDEYPLVIAHAGSELYPTDTMYAFERYAAMGVDILEMDTNMTADGEIVVIHDSTIDRTTDGSGKVSEMTLEEIQQYDAAYNWTQDDGATYPLRGQSITVPSLREVFEAFPGYPMIVEIKQESPSMAGALCDLIKEYGMEKDVMVPSFSDTAMQEFRTACPAVATHASTGEVTRFVILNFLGLSGVLTPQYQAFGVPESEYGIPIVNRWFVWNAHRHNLDVQIWTINDPEEMQRFIDMGVDGIMTDRTDLMLELLQN